VAAVASTVIVIDGGKVHVDRAAGRSECQAPGSPVRVAIARNATKVAVLTTETLVVWFDGECRGGLVQVQLPDIDRQRLVALAFGNDGRSLLVGDALQLVLLQCADGRCGAPVTYRFESLLRPQDVKRARFCEAVISSSSDLVAAVVGACGSRSSVCVFAGSTHCEQDALHNRIAFDPAGQWLVAARPNLVRWSVADMTASRLGTADKDPVEWAPNTTYPSVADFDVVGFAHDGWRLMTAKLYGDNVALTVYQWPPLAPLQTVTFQARTAPKYIVAGERIVIGTERSEATSDDAEQFAFDFRHDPPTFGRSR
jgi:hypothetical protein